MSMNTPATEEELMSIEINYWLDQAQALERLQQNADFKLVIEEGYFKDRVLDGVSLLATDYVKKSGTRPDIMENLVAISRLQDHFAMIKNMGASAAVDLAEDTDIEG